MLQQNKDKQDKQLSEDLVALFLTMLSFKSNKEFKKLLSLYKQNRDEMKESIGKIYLKYIKDNKLVITQKDSNKEIKLLESKLTKIGNDIRKQENIILAALLFKTFKDTYSKSIGVMSKYKIVDENNHKLLNKTVMLALNSKVNGKTNVIRNKENKDFFVNKVKTNIKKSFTSGKSIEVINKTIDKNFQESVNVSNRLIDNEVSRVFNIALIQVYKEMGVEKVVYNSTLDVNTCTECASNSGEIFNIDDAIDLPLHVSCNCFYTPLL